jgi:hypothetical protein
MKKRLTFVWVGLLLAFGASAQEPVSPFQAEEFQIRLHIDSLKAEYDDSVKVFKMVKVQQDLAGILRNPASYTYAFDSLKMMGKVKSPDNEFRIFTWNLVAGESTINFGIIQMKPAGNADCQVFLLSDKADVDQLLYTKVTTSNWYGALYYKVIKNQAGNKNYYTLLGYDSFSPYISKKLIDVLYFENGIPFFGAPVFQVSGKMQYRVVFSYSARVSMMLNYDEATKMIMLDHLSPSESRYTGQYEYYGPDFSYDGFSFNKTFWQYMPIVKSDNPKGNSKKKRK